MHRLGAATLLGCFCLLAASCASASTTSPKALSVVPSRPTVLAVGPNGHLYVADETRDQILERLPNGRFIVVAGTGRSGFSGDGGPAVDAKIDDPGGMVFGPHGTLYFADQGNDRVRAISRKGTITTVAGDGRAFSGTGFVTDGTPALHASITPYDVTFGPDGLLYIATGEQVLRLDSDGTLTDIVGRYQGHGIGGPAVDGSADGVTGIAFDKAGNLWFFGFDSKSIFMVTPSGTLTEPPGDQNVYAHGPGGLVTTPNGSVIAMAELSVVRLSGTGSDQTIISFYPGTFHGISGFSPNGIAVGPGGTIYIDTFYGNGFTDRSAIASISANGTSSEILWETTRTDA